MLQMHPLMFNQLKQCLTMILNETQHFPTHLIPESLRNATRGLLAELNGLQEEAKNLYSRSTHPIAIQRFNYLHHFQQLIPVNVPEPEINFVFKPIHFYYTTSMGNAAPVPYIAPRELPVPHPQPAASQAAILNPQKTYIFKSYNTLRNDCSLSRGEQHLLLQLDKIAQNSDAAKPTFAEVAKSLNRAETSVIDLYLGLYDRKIMNVWPALTPLGQKLVNQLKGVDGAAETGKKRKRDHRMELKHILN